MPRFLFLFIVFLLLSTFTFFAVTGFDQSPLQLLQSLTNTKQVFTPGPLRGSLTQSGADLTVAGILAATNNHRAAAGLRPLKLNSTLNQAATNKANDMFALQYFEHESPTGVTPADVVDNVGYAYLQTGENLALGNYESDAALVQAWMDSPGHRENIMKSSYTEIGISAIPGTFEDHHTWMSVQTFATPTSACPAPASKLQSQFDQQQANLTDLDHRLAEQASTIDDKNSQLQNRQETINQLITEGNQKIKSGNARIKEGNAIAESGGDIDTARELWDEGHALQAEGEALHEQVRQKQAALSQLQSEVRSLTDKYNQQLAQARSLESELKALTDQLNNQVRSYNKCLDKLNN